MEKRQVPTFEAIEHAGGQVLIIKPISAVGFLADTLRGKGHEVVETYVAGDMWVAGSIDEVKRSLDPEAQMISYHLPSLKSPESGL